MPLKSNQYFEDICHKTNVIVSLLSLELLRLANGTFTVI